MTQLDFLIEWCKIELEYDPTNWVAKELLDMYTEMKKEMKKGDKND